MKKNGRDGIADIEAVQKKKWENDDMKKRIPAVFLAVGILASLLSGCGKKPSYVTRGEWVAMLAEGFGLEDSQNTTPYYTDVTEKHDLFPAVQALGDWGILAPFPDKSLGVNKPVTRQEVAATAAIAAGFRPGESFEMEQAVAFAAEKGILSQGEQTHVTVSELEPVLAAAKEVYLNDPGEERMVVELDPSLIDLRKLASSGVFQEAGPGQCFLGAATLTTREDGQTMAVLPWSGEQIALGPGDTFIAPPTAEFPLGIAHKITAVHSGENMVILDVEKPALSDLYEKLDVRTTVHANLNDIIWAQGVSATGECGEYTVSLLSNTENSVPAFEKEFVFQQGKHEKDWTRPNSFMGSGADASAFYDSNFVYTDTPSLDDFDGKAGSWEKKLLTENKFSAGYKITGKLTIQDISVTPDIQFLTLVPPIPERAGIAINADMSAQLTLEGTLNERLKIGSLPMVVTPLGLTVNTDIYLYVDAYGAIQAEAALDYNAKVEWALDAGFRKEQSSSMKTSLGVEADIGFGGDIAAAVYAFGFNVFDAGAKVGGEITAQAKVVGSCEETVADGLTTQLYTESMKVEAALYAPIVTLYVGSEDCVIGEGESWDLLTKENTWSLPLLNKEWVFWKKALHFDEDGNAVEIGPVAGDFSEYAGTYRAEATMAETYGVQCPDLVLHEDGSITGGGFYGYGDHPFPTTPPVSVEEVSDGTYSCFIVYIPETGTEEYYDGYQEGYTIYPPGISDYCSEYMGTDISMTRLEYGYVDGGVINILYRKID